MHLKLKLEALENIHWIFVGIVKGDTEIQNNSNSFGWTDSYGWAVGVHAQAWKNRLTTTEDALKNLIKEGDTVELVLDCDAAKLSLHVPTGHQFHIDLPKSKTWRLNVNLHYPNDKIRIINQ